MGVADSFLRESPSTITITICTNVAFIVVMVLFSFPRRPPSTTTIMNGHLDVHPDVHLDVHFIVVIVLRLS